MTGLRQAAVLVPFYRDEQRPLHLVLIERAARGRHAGQIALPGGNAEPGDADPQATAVREACEEIGLTLAQIEVLDELPVAHTATTGYEVHPFVPRLRDLGPDPVWRPQLSEVAAVIDVPATELTDPDAFGEETFYFPGWEAPRRVPVRYLRGHPVWGLTLRILDPVLPRALADAWPL